MMINELENLIEELEKSYYDYCEACAAELEITVDHFLMEFEVS
jgi:hypothetical protein